MLARRCKVTVSDPVHLLRLFLPVILYPVHTAICQICLILPTLKSAEQVLMAVRQMRQLGVSRDYRKSKVSANRATLTC